MTIETDLAETTDGTIRVPANLMGFIRASYDTREKVLDWCLAIGVALAMAYTFRTQLSGLFTPDVITPNAGRVAGPQPSQDVHSAFPNRGRGVDVLTYNMPVSRAVRYSIGPNSTLPPADPSQPPTYPVE